MMENGYYQLSGPAFGSLTYGKRIDDGAAAWRSPHAWPAAVDLAIAGKITHVSVPFATALRVAPTELWPSTMNWRRIKRERRKQEKAARYLMRELRDHMDREFRRIMTACETAPPYEAPLC